MIDMKHRSETILACLPKSPFSEQVAQLHSDMLGTIDQLRARVAELEAQRVPECIGQLIEDLRGLIEESEGVTGLHLNGAIAPWDELLPGGRFERLSTLDEAEAMYWPEPTDAPQLGAVPELDNDAIAPVDEREAFEAWASGRGFDLSENWAVDGNNFESADTRLAYEIWQAARAQLGAVPEGCALIPLTERMPDPDKHPRVVVYTEGTDFAGEQFFDVQAESLNENYYADPADQPEICRYATHWIGADELAARAQPAQEKPE